MKKLIIFCFIVLFLSSCATFRSDMTNRYSKVEKNYNAEKKSVLFVFSHQRQTLGYDAIPKLDNPRQRIYGFDEFFGDALNELSNVGEFSTFTEYASDVNEPQRRAFRDSLMKTHDYVIKMKFKREKSFAKQFLGTIVSSATVTLFPVPYSQKFMVDVDVFSNDKLLNHYERSTKLSRWVQTFLILVYPFYPERRQREQVYVDMMHDVFKQIEVEKIIK